MGGFVLGEGRKHVLEEAFHRRAAAVSVADRHPRRVCFDITLRAAPELLNHVAHDLLSLAEHLLNRERRQVDGEAALDHDDRAVDTRAQHLDAGERPEEDLSFVRVLREPADLGTPIDHPLLHLDHDASALAARGVPHGDQPLGGRRHERLLDATSHVEFVGRPKLVRELHARDAAVDLDGLGELAQLDDNRVDGVQRARVLVHRLPGHLEGDAARRRQEELVARRRAEVRVGNVLGAAEANHLVAQEGGLGAEAAQHSVVLDEHRPGVQDCGYHLLCNHFGLVRLAKLLVLIDGGQLQRLERAALPSARPVGQLVHGLHRPARDTKLLGCHIRTCHEMPLDPRLRLHAVVARGEDVGRLGAGAFQVVVSHPVKHLGVGRAHDAFEAAEEGVEARVRERHRTGKLVLHILARRRTHTLQRKQLVPNQLNQGGLKVSRAEELGDLLARGKALDVLQGGAGDAGPLLSSQRC